MRLFFVLDEGIYHPEFFADFLRRTKDKVIGAALVTKVPKKNNIERYFLKHLNYFTPEELAKMAWTKADMKSKDAFQQKNANSKFYSVKSVLEFFHIPFFRVKEDINKKEYIFKMRGFEPDVIVSSNPLIFGKEILALPKICCLNRHSALLPSYGGVLPVLQAFRKGEKFTGASIHTMEHEIDKGKVLSQRKVPIHGNETLHELYSKCFDESVEALFEALDKVRNQDFSKVGKENKPSYYSWPTKEHWKDFRKKGGRVI